MIDLAGFVKTANGRKSYVAKWKGGTYLHNLILLEGTKSAVGPGLFFQHGKTDPDELGSIGATPPTLD